jgi:hypothetical protein
MVSRSSIPPIDHLAR